MFKDPSEYKSVWISLFDYFCNEKNLHNLLWIYSPDQGAPTPPKYYPGDDYVDIVALDVYVDDPVILKIPFFMNEEYSLL
jgi:mannan endo-1,4-beta-mannosidase